MQKFILLEQSASSAYVASTLILYNHQFSITQEAYINKSIKWAQTIQYSTQVEKALNFGRN